MTYRAQLA